MTELTALRRTVDKRKNDREYILRQLDETKANLKKQQAELRYIEKAKLIIQTVAQATQKELEFHISEISTLALSAVFNEPYELDVHFVLRRGRTETDLKFIRAGEEIDPMTASGGGAVDVGAFALRVALWSMTTPRSRAVIILDEPFKWLSSDLQSRAGAMMKEISEKAGVQFIVVSHVPDVIENADKVFEVRNKNGISQVEER